MNTLQILFEYLLPACKISRKNLKESILQEHKKTIFVD